MMRPPDTDGVLLAERRLRVLLLAALAVGCGPASVGPEYTAPPEPAEPAGEVEATAEPVLAADPAVVAIELADEAQSGPIPFEWPEETGALPEEVREALRIRLENARSVGQLRAHGEALGASRSLREFYRARAFFPVWFDEGRIRRAEYSALLAAIREAESHGLDPADYHLGTVEALPGTLRGATVEALAGADLLLSETFLTLADHLLNGKVDPVHIHPSWNIERKQRDLLLLLRDALGEGAVAEALASLAPADPRYRALRDSLARHRAVARAGGWPRVTRTPRGRAWSAATRRTLGARLEASGDLSEGGELEAALRGFQARVGVRATGELDEPTLAALETSVEDRIGAIEASLERWRWLPETLGRRHLLVNIADFRLELIEEGATTLAMKAVVGKPYRSTPVFSGLVRYLVLNPTWTAPRTIVREDLLPELQQEGAVALERRGIELFTPQGRRVDPSTVRWASIRPAAIPYIFRQPAGPSNALGPVKFMFPNPYDVYLHGTPRQELFDESSRAFSSGCVRLEHPLDLAERLLSSDSRWPRARIDEVVAAGETRSVPLREPTPVHVLYWTAWVDEEGRTRFRPDVYERDDAVLRALGRVRPETIPVVRASSTEEGAAG